MVVFSLHSYLTSLLSGRSFEGNELYLKPGRPGFHFFSLYLESQTPEVHEYDLSTNEIWLILAGKATVRVRGKKLKIKPGNALFLPKDEQIGAAMGKEALLVKMKFSPEMQLQALLPPVELDQEESQIADQLNQKIDDEGCLWLKNKLAMRPAQLLEDTVNSYFNKDMFAAPLANAQLASALVYSIQAQRYTMAGDVNQVVFEGSTLDGFIDAHYMDVTLKQAADYFGFNENYFSTLVKNKTGKSFVDHVNERRMIEAKRLLAQPDMSLKEVIHTIGYTSKSFFYKKFSEYYGTTPAAMRQQLFKDANINLH
ncbi:MAG: AraC family transcriptional regulator [Lactobacillus sp.]|jgi:AraC-like DNA-binding protein|nr:AraC family transcriptional regulator [Lactobacillus sp.]MCH4068572.1 AraC family transcriptional regulator [Lactobacillus sp.]MCI1304133.1 AraC family transcriptional regulator [Lactobacillus sp.]MCI1330290.1 AraC family transcriptional regulator [Lactobacillus sp.]MCI1358963.1 AraC family transcriptional regulator [Lactobacillus sp.]